jgi:uncharacterized cofD-like protein
VALSESSKLLRDMFNYRFSEGSLKGHNFGNIFLSTLEKQTGSLKKSIAEVGKILNIKGQVVPITFTKNTNLCVDLVDGKTIVGETHIDEVEAAEHRAPIKRVYLKPKAVINEDARKAIEKADYIIIGPGDLYTSILPNILVTSVPRIIKNSKAKKIFVVNLMTKLGHTTSYGAKKHVEELEKYLGKNVLSYVLINTKLPKKITHSWYQEFEEYPVEDDLTNAKYKIIRGDFLKDVIIEQNPADSRRRSIIRHDPTKLAKRIASIIYNP